MPLHMVRFHQKLYQSVHQVKFLLLTALIRAIIIQLRCIIEIVLKKIYLTVCFGCHVGQISEVEISANQRSRKSGVQTAEQNGFEDQQNCEKW